MSHISVRSSSIRLTEENATPRQRFHGWVFPPSPVTQGVLVGMNDALAEEIIGMIRDCCSDDNGNMIFDGSNGDLLTFASRLEQNIAQKAMRKTDRE